MIVIGIKNKMRITKFLILCLAKHGNRVNCVCRMECGWEQKKNLYPLFFTSFFFYVLLLFPLYIYTIKGFLKKSHLTAVIRAYRYTDPFCNMFEHD